MSTIRTLFPAEADALRAHLKRLDAEARRWRFGQPVTDEAIDRLVDGIDWLNSLHFGYFVDGVLRGSAELVWSLALARGRGIRGPLSRRTTASASSSCAAPPPSRATAASASSIWSARAATGGC